MYLRFPWRYRRFVIASRDPSNDEEKSEENLSPTPNSVESVELSSSTPTPPVNAEEGSVNSHEATGAGTPRKSSFVNSEEDFMRYMARFQQVHKTSKVAHAQVPKRKVLRVCLLVFLELFFDYKIKFEHKNGPSVR